jgi:hypothetical protein
MAKLWTNLAREAAQTNDDLTAEYAQLNSVEGQLIDHVGSLRPLH